MTAMFCILAFVCGFIVYRTGFKDGQRVSEGGKIKSLIPKKVKITDEEKRINKGMENILNYANRKSRGGNLDG